MPFKVQIGPPQISIHQGQTVLISEPDGQINWPSERGLYFLDTRVVSSWAVYANGETWELLNGGAITYYAARIFLTNRSFATENGTIPPRTLGFTISRWIGGGMHEDLEITNNGMKPVKFQLEIAIRCDFADLFEVKSGNIVRRGRITTEWSEARQYLRTIYRNDDFSRSVTISAQRFPTEAVYANGRLSFEVALDPGEAWHTCLLYTLQDNDKHSAPPHDCIEHHPASRHAETLADWLRTVAKIQTSNEEFYRLFRRALEDMAALRLPIEGTDHIVFLPAAGLPWFIAPFGRDSLIVSLQNILVYPEFARGSLDIPRLLCGAKEDDPYRDAEPGKIFHELRYGRAGSFQTDPPTHPIMAPPTPRPLYLITLHAAWRATGDQTLLERHLETVEGCLYWIDKYGDRDGDGFQEYQTRSPAGYENMAWKGFRRLRSLSGRLKLVKWTEGTLRAPGLCLQRLGSAPPEVFDALGKCNRAADLRAKAAALFERFNTAFWDDELGFYAYALDGDKKKVPDRRLECCTAIAFGPASCLASGPKLLWNA